MGDSIAVCVVGTRVFAGIRVGAIATLVGCGTSIDAVLVGAVIVAGIPGIGWGLKVDGTPLLSAIIRTATLMRPAIAEMITFFTVSKRNLVHCAKRRM